jgi:hypothetical protein
MIRKKFGLIFSLLISTFGFTQTYNHAFVEISEKVIGQSVCRNVEIKAKEYKFTKRVDAFYVDTLTNMLIVRLRDLTRNGKYLKNNGEIVLFDLTTQEESWRKTIYYDGGSSILQFESFLIQSNSRNNYRLDIKTGKRLWELKNDLYIANSKENIGVGYKKGILDEESNLLQGIDLSNGEVLWERELDRTFGWDNIGYLNDSTLLISSSGLHVLNLYTGEGWSYSMSTADENYRVEIASVIGQALGFFSGIFVMPMAHSEFVSGLHSNVHIDTTDLYYASKEKLVKIDRTNGQEYWSYVLPVDSSSMSTILLRDSLLVMLNRGMANKGSYKISFGQPYLAAFDAETGENRFISILDADPVLGTQIKNEKLYLVFKNKVSCYSLLTGSFLSGKDINVQKYGDLYSFVGGNVFVNGIDSSFSKLVDSQNVFVHANNNVVLEIDVDCNVVDEISRDEIYVDCLGIDQFSLLVNNDMSFLVDSNNNKIAEVDVSRTAKYVDGKLYDYNGDRVIEIDISKLLIK